MFVLLLEDSVKEELCKVNCEVKREELVPVSLQQHFVVTSVIEESKPAVHATIFFSKISG